MLLTCEYCESPIGSEDYICPYCYTRQTTPFFDTTWFWPVALGLIVAVCMFIMVDYAAGLGVFQRLTGIK